MIRIVVAVALLASLGACGEAEKSAAPGPKVDKETVTFPENSSQSKVLVSTAAEVATQEKINVPGRIIWDETQTVRIFAPVGGRIVRLLAQPGDKVKAGQTLATLTSPDFGDAQSDAAKAEADYAVAQKGLDRARELNKAGIMADKDYQQAEADYARAQAERNRARARMQAYGGGANVDQQFALHTPLAGLVVERNANPGQEVRPDQAQPGTPALFVVSDPSRLWINLELPEAAIEVVKPGMTIDLHVPALGNQVLNAKIVHVADFIDPTTRSTRARAVIDNPDRKLKAEMFVNADIEVTRPAFVRVPSAAVILLGKTEYVFVDEGNNRYRRQKVEAEEAGFGYVRITEGLKSGDKVVTEGALLLQQILANSK